MAENNLPAERFDALSRIDGVVHAFATRVPGLEVQADKSEALRRLDRIHRAVRNEIGLGDAPFITAQQVHGKEIAVITPAVSGDRCFDGCDGIITDQPGICLGIYVADCCAVYLVDPVRKAIGLLHSGKKGTELGIAPHAVELMRQRFGSRPADLVAQLSPCVRPPNYEVDFAAEIVRSLRACGVEEVDDSGVCTACDLERYYSYRAEKGRTGRMLALLSLSQSPSA